MGGDGPRGALPARVSRNLPLALSGAARRFAEDPWRGRVALDRAWRRFRGARSAGTPARGRGPSAALRRAVAIDDLAAAEDVLARLGVDDPQRPMAEGAVLLLRGRIDALLGSTPEDPRARPWRRAAQRQARMLGSSLPASLRGPRVEPPVEATRSRPPARILHVVTNSLPLTQAGSTIRTQGVVHAQRSAGWDAQVVTRPGYPVLYGELDAARLQVVDGVPYHRLLPRLMPPADGVDREYRRLLDELVRDLDPHLLHAASDHVNARAALEVGRARGIPVAYEVRTFFEDTWLASHGGEESRDSDVYRLLRERHTEVILAADSVTTLSDAMRVEILARGASPDRVVVTPNAVDPSFLSPRVPAPRAREALGLPEAYWVGSLATFQRYEGLETLVDAVARLRDAGSDARILLVGDGPALADLRARAASAGVPLVAPGRVPFAEVLGYYDALDVFALPRTATALNERVTALKPLEAQARGLPVVGSDLPAVREVVPTESPLVPAGDAPALAAALAVLADPVTRAERGEAARAWVASCRTWPYVTEAYRGAYAALGVPVGASGRP